MEYIEIVLITTRWKLLLGGKSTVEKLLLTKALLREIRTQLEVLESEQNSQK